MVDFEKLSKRIKICDKCKHDPNKKPDIRMDETCRSCKVFTEKNTDNDKFESVD